MQKKHKLFFSILFILLFLASYHHSVTPAWQLSSDKEGVPMRLTGWVASLPVVDKWQSSFNFRLASKPALIKLTWRGAPKLRVGDKWQIYAKLKRIHGTHNPGGFDYDTLALQQGLVATGSIVKNPDNKLLITEWYRYPVSSLRQYLYNELLKILPHSPQSPWLLALSVGDRSNVRPEDWDVLRNTGTNHLMAIAGLHIGMVGGFVYLLAFFCWRRFYRGMLLIPAQFVAAIAGLIIACIYGFLSGFEIPAQRACIMLFVFVTALILRRQLSAWRCWLLALGIVLALHPLSVLTESFWLSFGTLAIIIYSMSGRLHPAGIWWHHFRIQWVIGFGLIPFALYFFQQTSLVSFFANAIAIPWLVFSILPFCLLAAMTVAISPMLASMLLLLADQSLSLLWKVLVWFALLPHAAWVQPVPDHYCLFTTIVAFALLLLPAGMPGRILGLIWLLPILCYQYPRPDQGEFWLNLLDVGQGLSVVVQTKRHALIYDTGPKLSARTDAGKNIVIPFLHSQGINAVDRLVVSHPDNDHIGGAAAILSAFNIPSIMSSTPEKLPQASYCLAGYKWRWDGIDFEFLHPSVSDLHLDNNSSCVLAIGNRNHRALLTGDIEKAAEYVLLSKAKDKLHADILVAPHHGSKTSAVPAFVQAVHPHYVLYATGYRNRYHFPHQEVVTRYQQLHAIQMNTAEVGMIRFKVGKMIAIAENM